MVRIAGLLWVGVLLALEIEGWPVLVAIVLLCLLVAALLLLRRSRLLLAILLVALALVQIRESGEKLVFESASINFEIVARADADRLPKRVYGSETQELSCSFRAESRRLAESIRQVPLRVISEDCSVFFGERLTGFGRVRPSAEQRVAGTLIIDEITSRQSMPLWHQLDQIRKSFRSFFVDLLDAGSLVPGMVIGDTALQSDEFDAAMRLAGLSHLTAVSGANFSIVATLVLWLVSLRIRNRNARIVITAMTLLFFTIVVRPSPSVLRAGVMAAVVLYAQIRGNQRSSLLALAGAVTLLLLIDPYQGADAGFALSVLATLGIIVIAPRLADYFQGSWRLPRVVAEILSIPISATLLCTPVVIAISGKLSFAAIPLNIIAAPLVPIVTLLGFAALLLTPFSTNFLNLAAEFLAYLAHLAAWPIASIAPWSFRTPIIEMPFGLVGGAIFIGALALIMIGTKALLRSIRGKSRTLGILASFLIAALLFVFISSGRQWQLYQCDVGQGDALLVRTSFSSAMVIDLGPDPTRIDRCLRMAGVRTISLLVITHLHADHYGGLSGALRGRKVLRWWISPDSSQSSAHIVSELTSKIGFPGEQVQSGMRFTIDKTEIELLWPDAGTQSAPRLNGDGSEQNNRSIALMIYKDGAYIFTAGDIEPYAQEEIVRRHDLSKVDIYKVSHHGSGLRSARFDQELDPVLAIISVGERNPYGHPAPETLEALAPARIHRTDLEGSLRVTWWPIRIR